jgi:phosphoribosylformylglycinamidine cyclo-ligase
MAGCALVGGESAEHPGMMPEDEYDIAGFTVGFVDYDDIIDGSSITPGDVIIGIKSSGLHSNGFSLVRKVFADELKSLDSYVPDLSCTLGEELLRPTRIYVKPLLSIINEFKKSIKGISNITGGGHFENIPRMLPEGIRAIVDVSTFPEMPIFSLLSQKGSIPTRDMFNTFNMGIGLVLAVSSDKANAVIDELRAHGEDSLIIGQCAAGVKGVDMIW